MSNKPSVIVISSHVARGSVGNRAAVFALEAFAYPVWAVPTLLLPWHPGHGAATRIVPEQNQFEDFLSDISKAPWISEVKAILTGYMANPDQVVSAARMIRRIKSGSPDTLYVCDPVIGDVGGLYVSELTADAIRHHLLPLCDIATPNRYELAWLLETPTSGDALVAVTQARALGPETVLVTSVSNGDPSFTGNLLVNGQKAWTAFHEAVGNPPNGPGDLTAATFLAHFLDGVAPDVNLALTTASVLEILLSSTRQKSDELMLERDVSSLLSPVTNVTVSNIGES